MIPGVFSYVSAVQLRREFIFAARLVFSRVQRSLHSLATLPLVAREAHGDAHAAADAERGEALLGIALLHFVQQRDQHARAGCTDRMTDRDRAAIDVDLGGIPAQVLVDGAGL